MRLITKKVPMNFNLFLFSCTHWGSTYTHRSGWQQLVDMIMSPYAGLPASANYGIHHGDVVEAKVIDHPHFIITGSEPGGIIPQMTMARDLLRPISKKLITILMGNHERRLQSRHGDITAWICKELDVPYGTMASKITYRRKKDSALLFKQFAIHGSKQVTSTADDIVRQEANMQLALKRHLKNEAGDTILMSKGHCLSADTEVLTRDGWKSYLEIGTGDRILTFNTATNAAEWDVIEDFVSYRDQFPTLIEFKTPSVDIAVTPEHRMIVGHYQDSSTSWREVEARDAAMSWIRVPVAGHGPSEDFPLPDHFVKLLGWLISEGHFRKNGAIQLFQRESKAWQIREVLRDLRIPFSEYLRKFKGRVFTDTRTGKRYRTKEDSVTFYIKVSDATSILRLIRDKLLPRFIVDFSDRQFELFLNALMAGDGHWNPSGNSGQYFTKDETLAEQLQAAAIAHGWSAHIAQTKRKGFVVSLHKTITKDLVGKAFTKAEIPATSVVWCVKVKNGTLFTRRNKKVSVVGNTHRLFYAPPKTKLYLVDDGKRIRQEYTHMEQNADYIPPDLRWYVNVGAFFRKYGDDIVNYDYNDPLHGASSSYVEENEYPPVELGFAVASVRDGRVTDINLEVVD